MNDKVLIDDLLDWMEKNKADYTNTFCYLMNIKTNSDEIYNNKDYISWSNRWQKRISINNNSKDKSLNLMKKSNPIVIPRNHKVEEALKAANENNIEPMNKLLSILNNPYETQSNIEEFQSPSSDKEYQTFCGT
jgi:uncharacterized protein YdiU (UPF0061 family)